MTGIKAHATLGASSAKRWMNCTGSIREIEALPPALRNVETVYAAEGTAAHKVGSTALEEDRDAIEFVDRVFGAFTVDEDMAEAVQLYVNTVRAEYDPDAGDILFIEKQFSLAALNPPRPMFGTTDCAVFKPRLGRLVVIDYKHGAGVVVDATDNDQGRYYALGACIALADYPITEVEVVIVQPRAPHADGPVRRETVSAFDLIEWSAKLLDKARETMDPNAPLTAGDHCRFCPAKAVMIPGPDGQQTLRVCREYQRHANAVAHASFDSNLVLDTVSVPAPSDLSPEEVGKILDGGRFLVDWYRAVQGRAFEMMQSGVLIPNWKLVPKRSRRKWFSEEEAEVAARLQLDFGFTEEQIWAQVLRSPAQMKKQIRGRGSTKAREELDNTLTEKKSSGATFAPVTDRRPAIGASLALEFDLLPPTDDDEQE